MPAKPITKITIQGQVDITQLANVTKFLITNDMQPTSASDMVRAILELAETGAAVLVQLNTDNFTHDNPITDNEEAFSYLKSYGLIRPKGGRKELKRVREAIQNGQLDLTDIEEVQNLASSVIDSMKKGDKE